VGYPCWFHVHFARYLARRTAIPPLVVADAFFPLVDALAYDRSLIAADSILASALFRLERSAYRTADLCLIDTQTHADYLAETYLIDRRRIIVMPVGPTMPALGREEATAKATKRFEVVFVGTFIPLHGVHIILEAARILKQKGHDVRFAMVGSGQLRQEAEETARRLQLNNVSFRDWIQAEDIPRLLSSADLCLGVFGNTPKAQRVIPTKVYDMCAAGVPFITADTQAIREVFVHRHHAFLVPSNDAKALADAIVELRDDAGLRRSMGRNARQLLGNSLSLRIPARRLLSRAQQRLAAGA
jgi:glycosyltransferase involved in cell wall biosynthesis